MGREKCPRFHLQAGSQRWLQFGDHGMHSASTTTLCRAIGVRIVPLHVILQAVRFHFTTGTLSCAPLTVPAWPCFSGDLPVTWSQFPGLSLPVTGEARSNPPPRVVRVREHLCVHVGEL